MSSILEQVKDIVANTLGIEKEGISDDAHLMDDLNADSLAKMELVMKLEDEFQINIPEKDTDSILTVRAIAAYVDAQKSA